MMAGEPRPQPQRPVVLIAHESATIREAVRWLVTHAGYRAVTAADGLEVLDRFGEGAPDVLVVDVGLPKRMGFEICEEVKVRQLHTKVILVASVYQRTAYKRRPTSLYGADDYVEQHHIPDMLLDKIAQALPAGLAGPAEPDFSEADAIKRAGEGRLRLRYTTHAEGVTEAQRLAALIVSDIALYNGDEFIEGLDRGEPTVQVRADLAEGRAIIEAQVPAEIRGERDFIAEALSELVSHRGRERDKDQPDGY